MGYQIIVSSILHNWTSLTKGPNGIPGIPKPTVFGWRVNGLLDLVILSSVAVALVALLHWQQTRSPYGRALQAVRDDELAARALGKNPAYFKLSAFVLSGSMAALAGAMYAGYASFIDPTSFGINEAIFALTVVIIGGAGSGRGPILGAAFVVLLPEALRFLHVPDTVGPSLRQVIYGLLLILMMRFRPQGIAGGYAFD
jgi:branched-chain amino acid transport system permease protein